MDIATIRRIPGARIYNLARIRPEDLEEKSSGNGSAIVPKGAPAGELADCVWIGFMESSNLIEGRTYSNTQGQSRLLKECQISPLQQEYERSLAVLSTVLKGKMCTLPVTEHGCITFSTKHSSVDENGNALGKSTLSYLRLQR